MHNIILLHQERISGWDQEYHWPYTPNSKRARIGSKAEEIIVGPSWSLWVKEGLQTYWLSVMGVVWTGPWLYSLCIVSAAHGILHCQIRCSWSHVRAYSFWSFSRQVHVCCYPLYELGIGCLLQLLVGWHMSITGRSGQALAGSSIMGRNVPPCTQLGIDMSTKLLGLTNTQTS